MTQSDIEALLPEIYRRTLRPGSPLDALLGVMTAFLARVENGVNRLPDNLSADRAEDQFVYFLARLMDLDRFFEKDRYSDNGSDRRPRFAPGTQQLRALIRDIPELTRLRGTSEGLVRFLESATGIKGFSIDERVIGANGKPLEFHVRILAPPEARAYLDLINCVIEGEKPAYVTHMLVFDGLTLPIEKESSKVTTSPDNKASKKPKSRHKNK